LNWEQLKQQGRIWRSGALPGFAVIVCVIVARLMGSLQALEWMAFDQTLRSRPVESADSRILIVGIDEDDIKTVGKYPIPDAELAKLLQRLQRDQPRAIGIDIFRDLTTGASRSELAKALNERSNVVGIEMALSPTLTVKPPPELPLERVGLSDVVIDSDGKLRRSLLASKVDGRTRYSFALLLAVMYLQRQGVSFQPGSRASAPIRLGELTLPRFLKNTGGYVNAKAGGNQVLLNFRASSQPFTIVSLTDVLSNKVPPDLIRDRVVLVGMTAPSVNDIFMTSATQGTMLANALNDGEQYQLLYGVEYQAHTISQLINAVLEDRPLFHTWLDGWEYVWIVSWGLLGIALGLLLRSPWKSLFSLGVSSICLVVICYGLMILGWWIPLVPALLALYAAGLTTSFFDRDARVLLEQRSFTLKRTYDAVHNGPLQTLAAILRTLDESPLRSQLESLNQELRSVYESMKQELLSGKSRYVLPISELLYQIYEETIRRDLPGFTSIQVSVPPNFDLLKDCKLSVEQKQGLCFFLQESLCNVGKHAIDANRLDVICTHQHGQWSLQIIDNGKNNDHTHTGRGTEQAKELARLLDGQFERQFCSPQGVVCQITWCDARSWKKRLPNLFGR
jgi:CHASE2 domain-containing sensor protein/two-component sensor histidine kinase